MNRRKGDVIVNPWVSKELDGVLNPCYATIYVGDGICVDYRGKRHAWVGLNDKNHEKEYKTIGHIDIDLKSMISEVIAQMDEVTE